jgi:hypothetical protein
MSVAGTADRFRASDVTLWGVIALFCWGAAVLSANLSGLLPPGVLAGLHSSRLDGGTVSQLRSQVATLAEESVRLRRETRILLQQFVRAEQASGEVTRRIGALEISVPQLIEQLPRGIDNSPTASIGGETMLVSATGGSVAVTQKPLLPGPPPILPDAATPPTEDAEAFGVALGRPVPAGDAAAQWSEVSSRVGPLLLGLAPLLQPSDDSGARRIVAGPVQSVSEAASLCTRLDLVGITCEAVPFIGEPLALN